MTVGNDPHNDGGAPIRPVPTDGSRGRRVAAVVLVSAAAIAIAGATIWAIASPRQAAPPEPPSIDPAQETSATTTATVPPPSSLTTTAPSEQPSSTASTRTPTAAARRQHVAFRLGGRIYVSEEDGSELTAVAPAAETYALSPDARTLAVVYASTDQLPPGCSVGSVVLWDVKSRVARCMGSRALPLGLSWSPDSRFVAYTASSTAGPVVKWVRATGSNAERTLGAGASPLVSPDGRRIVYAPSEQPGPSDRLRLRRVESGSATKLRDSAGAFGYGWSPGGALYFARPDAGDAWALVKSRRDGTGAETLGSYVPEPPAYALATVLVSPGGEQVLLAAVGDDDYSRLVVFDRDKRSFSAVPTRRDAYPCVWGTNGSILFFEGNAYQGEPSSLVSMKPDGTGKAVVVVGATR